MTYIEVHQALFTHRKTLKLTRILQMDKYAIVGRLASLWCWSLDNAPEGDLGPDFPDIIPDVMGWDDDPEKLVNALLESGFICREGDSYIIHDWMDYAGKFIEKRRADAERKRNARLHPDPAPIPPSSNGHRVDVRDLSTGHPSDGAGNVPKRTLAKQNEDLAPVAAKAAPSPKSASPSIRKPTPHEPQFQALCALMGYEPSPREKKNWWACAADILGMGGLPEDIPIRAERYRLLHPSWGEVTVPALAKYWKGCDPALPLPPDVTARQARASPQGASPPTYQLFDDMPKRPRRAASPDLKIIA